MTFQIVICLYLTFIATTYSKSTRIIGASDANVRQFPYQASLRRIADLHLICGGVIISNRHILTTAHCLNDDNEFLRNLIICLGKSTPTHIFGSTYLPEKITIHPEYTGNVDPVNLAVFDIAVIKLVDIINYNEYQKRVYLPTRNVSSGDIALLSGWGSISTSLIQFSYKLQVAWMMILDYPSCSTRINYPLTIDQFCAYQRPGVGVSIGDSGNPLVNNNIVLGLVLASHPYATGEPDLYVNVYYYLNFIRDNINNY